MYHIRCNCAFDDESFFCVSFPRQNPENSTPTVASRRWIDVLFLQIKVLSLLEKFRFFKNTLSRRLLCSVIWHPKVWQLRCWIATTLWSKYTVNSPTRFESLCPKTFSTSNPNPPSMIQRSEHILSLWKFTVLTAVYRA